MRRLGILTRTMIMPDAIKGIKRIYFPYLFRVYPMKQNWCLVPGKDTMYLDEIPLNLICRFPFLYSNDRRRHPWMAIGIHNGVPKYVNQINPLSLKTYEEIDSQYIDNTGLFDVSFVGLIQELSEEQEHELLCSFSKEWDGWVPNQFVMNVLHLDVHGFEYSYD